MTEMVTDEVLNQRMIVASIIIFALVIAIILIVIVTRVLARKLDIFKNEKSSMIKPIAEALSEDIKAGLNIRLSVDDFKAATGRIIYTEKLIQLVESIVQRTVAFHLYKQIGKLPLDKFTEAMQSNVIADVAKEVHMAIETDDLAAMSIISSDYLDNYIINTTIIAIDSTVNRMIATGTDSVKSMVNTEATVHFMGGR